MKRKHQFFLILASIIHAVLLIGITFFLLSITFLYGDEMIVFKYASIVKSNILAIDDKPEKDDLIFIDISWSNILLPKFDENKNLIGNQSITDREKLYHLFKNINLLPINQKPKFILCNILFKDQHPTDSLLSVELKKMNNIIIASKEDEKLNVSFYSTGPLSGPVSYSVSEDQFLKYTLCSNDYVKSLPLLMYEKLYMENLSHSGLFYKLGEKRVLNNFIVNLRVRYYDVKNKYTMIYLNELSNFHSAFSKLNFHNKILVIGTFEDEKYWHRTLYGDMSGTLILLNVFLNLVFGDNSIPFSFFIFLFVIYVFLSYIAFYPKDFFTQWIEHKIKKARFAKLLLHIVSYLFFLLCASILSYFIFNIHINIFLISIYLILLYKLTNYLYKKLKWNIL